MKVKCHNCGERTLEISFTQALSSTLSDLRNGNISFQELIKNDDDRLDELKKGGNYSQTEMRCHNDDCELEKTTAGDYIQETNT